MYLRNGLLFRVDIQQEFDDVIFPPNFFLDAEAREQYGIEEVDDPIWPDLIFYTAMQRVDGSIDKEKRPIAEIRNALKSTAAAKRYALEISGITIDSVIYATDRVSRNNMITELNGMKLTGAQSIQWKAKNAWATLSLEGLSDVYSQVYDYAQKCYNMERSVHDRIDSATTFSELERLDLSSLCQLI